MPRMILPLLFVSGWVTTITCISKFVWPLGVNSSLPLTILSLMRSVLLTVLGFVVALSLSLRSSTAYERYSEGRKSLPPTPPIWERRLTLDIGLR